MLRETADLIDNLRNAGQTCGGEIMKEEVSLRDLTAIIKQSRGMIIGFGLIGMVLSAIYTFLIVTPLYESKTQLLVNRASDDANGLVLNDINSNVQMINTYKDIIEGPVILVGVIEGLGLSYSVEELANQVTISANEDSQVFSLAVTSPDPDEAAQIANEIALNFQSNIVEIMNIENVKIISTAVPDSEPVSPHILNNLLIGLGVGVLAGFGISMLRYAMAKTIDDYQFITQTIGWPNLGVISELNKEERMAINVMQKQIFVTGKTIKEGEAVTQKRIPDDEIPLVKEEIIPEVVLEQETQKQPKKKQTAAHSGMNGERLLTVADMTREKIDVILQRDMSQTVDSGNKRGER